MSEKVVESDAETRAPLAFHTPAIIRWLQQQFGRRVDASSLAFFRIIWGSLMVYEGFRKLSKVSGIYWPEYFHFKYSLFPFVEPLPEVWMVGVEAWVLIAAAVLMTLGLGFRAATLVFTLIYSHFFLTDKLYYNNHFYLTILMNFLLAFTQADRIWSLRAWWRRAQEAGAIPTVPLWNLVILRGQVMVLYFFGGIAKLNADWLHGEPMRFWFAHKQDLIFPLSDLVQQEWFVNLACVGGIVLDLTAGFLLLHRRTFWLITPVLILFHAMNSQLFKIGIFPLMGIGMIALFFDPTWPRVVLAWIRGRLGRTAPKPPEALPPRVEPTALGTTLAVVVYLGFQALWPLRIWSYSDNPGWTEVGHVFSWRMMLRHKDSYVKFLFDPPEAERLLEETDQLPRISQTHVRKMVKSPHFILQYTHALDATLEKLGRPDVGIGVLAIASLDGRPYQLLIDPTVDLTKASYGWFEVPHWIVQLKPDQRPGLYPETAERRRQMMQAAINDYRQEHELPPAAQRVPLQPLPELDEDAY